jgi:hypothetical protein
MCNALLQDRLPDQRVVIRFDFTGFRPHERYWLLIEHGEAEICKTYPGLDEDLYITADAEAFVKWHAGRLSWAEATRDSRIHLHGPTWLIRAFPTWNARSAFAHIKPVSQTAAGSPRAALGRGPGPLWPDQARATNHKLSRRQIDACHRAGTGTAAAADARGDLRPQGDAATWSRLSVSWNGERKVLAFWALWWHSCVALVQVADPGLGSMLLVSGRSAVRIAHRLHV